jgi:hypothetical protein
MTRAGPWTLTLSGILTASALLLGGCASRTAAGSDGAVDQAVDTCGCKDPKADEDSDGIPDGVEGCCVDTDGDTIPNSQDFDSDDDGIYDLIEAGGKGSCTIWPCDTDGDGVPDYLDRDSDNDGLNDACEDTNGDGLLGCCVVNCIQPGGKQKTDCVLSKEGCGPGQSCGATSFCTPATSLLCSAGETDRLRKDTFGDGQPDKDRATAICRSDSCGGTQPQLLRHKDSAGDWQLAARPGAVAWTIQINGAQAKQRLSTIDYRPNAGVAGFILSRAPRAADLRDELGHLLANVLQVAPNSTPNLIASGTHGKSHDCYDLIRGTTLDLGFGIDPSTLRNQLVARILGLGLGALAGMPSRFNDPVPPSHLYGGLVVRLSLLRRFEFKKSSDGYLLDEDGVKTTVSGKCPADSGDASKRQLVVTGAVLDRQRFLDVKRDSRLLASELTDGTNVAKANLVARPHCEAHTLASQPTADILWVIDEGIKMHAPSPWSSPGALLFSRLLSAGVNFRMGVTGMVDPLGPDKALAGKLCSSISSDLSHDGGKDRFLLPSEQSVFASCFKNPPGAQASASHGLSGVVKVIERHLPRAANQPDRIRPGAALSVIVLTDKTPQEVAKDLTTEELKSCTVSSSSQVKLAAAIQPVSKLLNGTGAKGGAGTLHVVGGVCTDHYCSETAHGYLDLVWQGGGQVADVCTHVADEALAEITIDIAGAASPLKLRRTPISASLAVALDGVVLARSRYKGFSYNAAANSVVFHGVSFKKGSEVFVSYRAWRRGTLPGWL